MPEAVLIVGGYNHLTASCQFGTRADEPVCADAIEEAEDALREVIRVAKNWPGVRYVYVATLAPPGTLAPDASRDLRIDPSAVTDMNNRVRFSTVAGGAILVDVAAAFAGHEAEYVSVDGLHLRPAGYQTIANLFYARILETVPQTNPARVR
jgi:lysophospholipase L1-like esterase